jgi:hypothetical protein
VTIHCIILEKGLKIQVTHLPPLLSWEVFDQGSAHKPNSSSQAGEQTKRALTEREREREREPSDIVVGRGNDERA